MKVGILSLAVAVTATTSLTVYAALPAAASSNGTKPLVAAVHQYYHHLDKHWSHKNAPIPPGLPLTKAGRADFKRRVGVINQSQATFSRHGLRVTAHDTAHLVGKPEFSSDHQHATARFVVGRTTKFRHTKYRHLRSFTVTDTYTVTFVRGKASGYGRGRWLIDSMTVPTPSRDDEGATVPPVPAGGPKATSTVPDVFMPPDKQSVVVRRQNGVLQATAARSFNGYDYWKMADYAKQWSSKDASGKELYNDNEYPRQGNNCMNFVSQSLFAGGWKEVEANIFQVENDSKWDGHVDPWINDLYRETITWRATSHWAKFATDTGRVTWKTDLFGDAALGDVILTDWDPHNRPDGTTDHAMIVTGWDEVFGPYISQNSPHRSNIPLTMSIHYAQEQGKQNIVWYLART